MRDLKPQWSSKLVNTLLNHFSKRKICHMIIWLKTTAHKKMPIRRCTCRSFSPLAVRGQFLRYVAFLHEFFHGVGRGRLPGAGMFEAAGVLLVQGLFSPGVKRKAKTCQRDDFHHRVQKNPQKTQSVHAPHVPKWRISYLCSSFSLISSCSIMALSSM